MVSESSRAICSQKQVERALCSKFRFPQPTRIIHSIYTEHNFMFYETEEYEGLLVVKYHCIRKTYLPESSTQSTSERDFLL